MRGKEKFKAFVLDGREKFALWKVGRTKIYPRPLVGKNGEELPNPLPVRRVRDLSPYILVYGGTEVPHVAKKLNLKQKDK